MLWYLLQIEWIKFRTQKAFQIIGLLFLVAMPSIILVARMLDRVATDDLPPFIGGASAIIGFPNIWKWLGYEANWLSFLALGFISILFITTEFAHHTIRQNILCGMSRTQWLGGKVLFILALSIAATLWYVCCAVSIGWWHTDKVYWNTIWRHSELAYRYLLLNMGYMSFGLFLGLLIRRTGLSIFLYFAWGLFIESALRWGVHFTRFHNRSFLFYPINAFEDLLPPPFAEIAQSYADEFAREHGFALYLTPTEAIFTSCTYIALFVGLSWWRLRKIDL